MSGIVAIILAAFCVISIISIVIVLRIQQPDKQDDSWRDRPPFVFRLIPVSYTHLTLPTTPYV